MNMFRCVCMGVLFVVFAVSDGVAQNITLERVGPLHDSISGEVVDINGSVLQETGYCYSYPSYLESLEEYFDEEIVDMFLSDGQILTDEHEIGSIGSIGIDASRYMDQVDSRIYTGVHELGSIDQFSINLYSSGSVAVPKNSNEKYGNISCPCQCKVVEFNLLKLVTVCPCRCSSVSIAK